MVKFSKPPALGTHIYRKNLEEWHYWQVDSEVLSDLENSPDYFEINHKPIYIDKSSLQRINFELISTSALSDRHYVERYAKTYHRMIYELEISYELKKNSEKIHYKLTCNLSLLTKGENLYINDIEEAIIRHEND